MKVIVVLEVVNEFNYQCVEGQRLWLLHPLKEEINIERRKGGKIRTIEVLLLR